MGCAGYDTLGDKLLTFQLYDQQADVRFGIIPLLQVDMWEHAYYLQHKNIKAGYVKAFWMSSIGLTSGAGSLRRRPRPRA
ncbi:hypothetical protein Y900_021425 [Mycolicibacterium aromaticivorans JS19b1 = JCM 16368]|uniref:superoxide dismutase n=1 Tax=Mycolicibacterium aromaticivorans JS19b1 = JCM 16368 TaxID=1440774 RepID=A0A064CLI4_9MYCO|nr:hypothetical protein Y900_021425 [Mycolicibacterium aromaticivorans JS19b1 = JCM 16368]